VCWEGIDATAYYKGVLEHSDQNSRLSGRSQRKKASPSDADSGTVSDRASLEMSDDASFSSDVDFTASDDEFRSNSLKKLVSWVVSLSEYLCTMTDLTSPQGVGPFSKFFTRKVTTTKTSSKAEGWADIWFI
jgi:hypothetical protein